MDDKVHKSGYVAIVGRPNVGKSTLLNKFLNEKVSIVSSRPQTTRNKIRAIVNNENYQIIFVDTPGIHKPKHKLGEYMVKMSSSSFEDVDLILFLVTPFIRNNDEIRGIELEIIEKLKLTEKPVFLVVNKIDEAPKERVAATLKAYSEKFDFKELVPTSALKNKNVSMLLELIADNLEEGPKYFEEDVYVDVNERFMVSEIIREKVLKLIHEEVPHGVAVDIVEMKEEETFVNIEAYIICEKENHKGIIIGKNGEMLKKINSYAKMDISKFLNKKVNLKIWVKAREGWRDSNTHLKEFGYRN